MVVDSNAVRFIQNRRPLTNRDKTHFINNILLINLERLIGQCTQQSTDLREIFIHADIDLLTDIWKQFRRDFIIDFVRLVCYTKINLVLDDGPLTPEEQDDVLIDAIDRAVDYAKEYCDLLRNLLVMECAHARGQIYPNQPI